MLGNYQAQSVKVKGQEGSVRGSVKQAEEPLGIGERNEDIVVPKRTDAGSARSLRDCVSGFKRAGERSTCE
jgi:hypothetical protein